MTEVRKCYKGLVVCAAIVVSCNTDCDCEYSEDTTLELTSYELGYSNCPGFPTSSTVVAVLSSGSSGIAIGTT